jgi:peptidyl-prolyl cis-trans isomerase C
MRNSVKHILTAALFAAATALGAISAGAAEPGTPVAKVNGQDITSGELRFAEADFGTQLEAVPPSSRRRVLLEYLIGAHLMAQAAEKAQLGAGADFDRRMAFYRTRALRDAFFESKVRDQVTDTEKKAYYDNWVKTVPTEQQVRARHILVKTEEEAKKIAKEIEGGADFAEAAKKYSQHDSKENGGDLEYFSRGQTGLKPFEDAAFALEKGKVSEPVKSDLGWHIIKVEDKRDRVLPSFDEVKDQITAELVETKLQTTVQEMRDTAKVEIVDPEVKKAIEAEAAADAAPDAAKTETK